VGECTATVWVDYAEKLGVGWFDCTPLWSGRLSHVCWLAVLRSWVLGLVGCVALGHRAENSHTT